MTLDNNQEHWLNRVARWLDGAALENERASQEAWLAEASESELEILVDLIRSKLDQLDNHSRTRALLQRLASRLVAISANREQLVQASIVTPESLVLVYDQLSSSDPLAAAHALQCLAAQADEDSLSALADVLVENPPESWQHVGISISPLWQIQGAPLEHFFARLESALIQPSTLAVLLDLANHAVRSRRIAGHPWSTKHADWSRLLQQVTIRLEKLQQNPAQFGNSVQEVQQVLADSVALCVSLCDTLGLIGNPDSAVALEQAMELAHRRIQAEAAAALAKLGDEKGISRLVALAADPVTRGRVIEYAEELDLSGAIDEKYRYPQALAESELAAWLARVEQYSLPPTEIEHIETRTLYWPGYEEPRDCFLFRFHYRLPQGNYTNIGIVGPLTRAFAYDLTSLSTDDQYAAFAGWHAEHEEIYEVPFQQLNPTQIQDAQRFNEFYRRSGFEVESTIALTYLLGEPALLASLSRDGSNYFGITDGIDSVCLPASDQPSSASPELVLSIYRGRKLLKAFN